MISLAIEGSIVRDFAYPPSDQRHFGQHPAPSAVEQTPDTPAEQESEEEEDDDDDESSYLWKWTFASAQPPAPTVVQAISATLGMKIASARTLFPFVKAQECEMSLKAEQGVLVLNTIPEPKPLEGERCYA
jgi:hypothetical protein